MKKTLIVLSFSLIVFSACTQDIQQAQQMQEQRQQNDQVSENTKQPTESNKDLTKVINSEIDIESPKSGETVSNPVIVKGKALGNWFFEGVLPVSMEDSDGNLLSAAPARALDDWMTEDFVEFEAQLDFDPGNNETAVIIIKNDNPSGLPENAKQLEIPVKLQ